MKAHIGLLALILFLTGCTTFYTYRGQKFADIPTALSHATAANNDIVSNVTPLDKPLVENSTLTIEYPSRQGTRSIIRLLPENANQTPEIQNYVGDAFGIIVDGLARAAIRTNAFEETEIVLTQNYQTPASYNHSGGWRLVSVYTPPANVAKWKIYSPSGDSNVVLDMAKIFTNDEQMYKTFERQFLSSTRMLAKRETVVAEKLVQKKQKEKDQIERQRLENLPISPAKGSGLWKKSVKTDPITDAKVVTMTLNAQEYSPSYKTQTFLAVRCNDNKIELYVEFDEYMTDSALVASRLDKQKAERKIWGSSTDKTAVFYPSSEIKVFIRQLFNARKFLARATPYNESPKTLTFDVRGLYGKLKGYEDVCGW